jgi:transcriptional regulator with XRE-family HTH domain
MSAEDGGKFGALLRSIRLQRGMSRAVVARKVGIDERYYGVLERGKKLGSLLVLARLSQFMEFDANEVLDGINVTVGEVSKRMRKAPIPLAVEAEGQYATFGRLLAEARSKANITQTAVANAIGVARGRIARVERGHSLPPMPKFAKWRRILGFDANIVLAQLIEPDIRPPFHGFGHVLQVARDGHSMTPAEVAKEVDCDVILYRRIELGAELPTFELAVHLHRVLRFDANAALRWLWFTGAMTQEVQHGR